MLKKFTSLVSVAALAASVIAPAITAAASEFLPYADYLAGKSVIKSTDEAGYRLGDNITRAEMAKVAANVAGLKLQPTDGKMFGDVTDKLGDLAQYIEAMATAGYVAKNANFRPLDLVTRAEMVKMLLNAKGIMPTTEDQGFTDIANIGDLAGYVNAAAKAGIVAQNANFRPNDTASRGEVFKVAAIADGYVASGDLNLGDLFGTGTTSTGTTSTGTTSTGTTSTGVSTYIPTSNGSLAVSLSPTTPAGVSAIGGASFIPMVDVNFTAGSSDAEVDSLTLTKLGYVSDSSINNVYLFAGNVMIAQTSSVSSGKIKFTKSGPLFVVKAGSTFTLSVKADFSSSLATGLGVGFSLASASDIVAGGSIAGAFPVIGNLATSTQVSNPSLATMTAQYIASATTVNAGTPDFIAGSFQLQPTNSAVTVKSIKVTQIGSINSANDLANVRLQVGGNTVATVPSLNSDGTATFDMGSGFVIASGVNTTFNIVANVIGGVNRQMTFTIQNNYDVVAMDNTYNVGIMPDTISGTATPVTINQGSLTISTSSASPTGTIVAGSNQKLSSFTFTANGEDVKLLNIPVTIKLNSTATGAMTKVTNLRLVASNGDQIGSTVNNPFSTDAKAPGSVQATYSFNADGASYINYVIPANQTITVSVVADLTNIGATSIEADLVAGTAKGITSNQAIVTSAPIGRNLTISTSNFNTALNASLGNISTVAGGQQVRVGSFTLSAGAGEGVNVTTISIASLSGNVLQNLNVKVNGTAYGLNQASVGAATYTFSQQLAIPAGGSVTVDAYADILSSASISNQTLVSLASAQATGLVTGTSYTGGAATGQTVTVGTGALVFANSSSNPANTIYPMGAGANGGITLGNFSLTASGAEGASITQLKVTDAITGSSTNGTGAFYNLTLWDGSTQIGSTVASLSSDGSATFVFNNPLTVAQSATKNIVLKASVSPYNVGNNAGGSTHQFSLSAAGLSATGLNSGISFSGNNVSGTATTNMARVYRTIVTAALDASTAPAGVHGPSQTDNVAVFAFTADSSADSVLKTISGSVAGSALSGSLNVNIVDNDTQAIVGSGTMTVSNTLGSGLITLNGNGLTVSAGTTKKLIVQINSASNLTQGGGGSGGYKSFQFGITGFAFDDNGGTTNAIPFLPSVSQPLNANTLQY